MKNFLLVTLVVGICIRDSIGKEKLKIDLPENFQVDFMKSFERVIRSDYPNCNINPEEVLGKIGNEFLKRAGAGLDIKGIKLEKRSVDDVRATEDEAIASHRFRRALKTTLKTKTNKSDQQNRKRRSAYEMLMDSIDEVKVKRSADFDQENAKRKRRSAYGMLMDSIDEVKVKRSADFDQGNAKRKQRSAYEMLMDSVDEVRVKRSADFDQGNAKRKRRSALDLLMDRTRSGNGEF